MGPWNKVCKGSLFSAAVLGGFHAALNGLRGHLPAHCHSTSSGRTGSFSGITDFISVSLLRAFLISEIRPVDVIEYKRNKFPK